MVFIHGGLLVKRRFLAAIIAITVCMAHSLIFFSIPRSFASSVPTWTQSGLVSNHVYTIAVSPNYGADSTVFAGTNNGIYKATDDTMSWVQSGLQGKSVRSVALAPGYNESGVEKTIFAVANDGMVYKSTDGGSQWVQLSEGFAGNKAYAVAISPNYAQDATLFSAAYNGVYKSIDGGQSWTKVSAESGQPNAISHAQSVAISPNYPVDGTVFIGSYSGVYKTSDSGQIWSKVDGGFQAIYVESIAVSSNYTTDGTVLIGASGGGIYKSNDRGQTWAQSGLTGQYAYSIDFSVNFATDQTVYAGTFGGGIYKTTDGGQTWVQSGLIDKNTYSVNISPSFDKDGIVFAGTDGDGMYSYMVDKIAPVIVKVEPVDNSTDVARAKTIRVTFSEDIQAGAEFEGVTVTDSNGNKVNIDKRIWFGKILVLDPVTDLSYSMTYTVTIPASAVKDAADNSYANTYAFSFTTLADPYAGGGTGGDTGGSTGDTGGTGGTGGTGSTGGGGGLAPPKDTTPPAAPQGLRLVSNKGSITLAWNFNKENDLAGYNVYRAVKGSSTVWQPLNGQYPITDLEYQDKTAVAGVTYIYYVTAVDETGNESPKDAVKLEASLDAATGGQVSFSDVPSGAWYKSYVATLVSKSIIGGYSDGTFKPNKTVSRAEFAKMICLAMGWQPVEPSTPSFNDVPKSHWAYKYIEAVKAHGAIGGYQDGSFKPVKDITRAEIAKIIASVKGLSSGSSALTDINGHWAKSFINACHKAGIIGGYLDGTFKPNNTASRAEAAKMIAGVLGG